MSAVIDRDRSLAGYPSLSAAAAMIGVATSTLSRRADIDAHDRGARDRVLAPGEVLRLATIYRTRSLNEVAGGLIEYAEQHAPGESERIEAEVEAFFADRSYDGDSRRSDDLLDELRAHLPSELYAEVEERIRESAARKPSAIVGEVVRSYAPATAPAGGRRSTSRSTRAASNTSAKKTARGRTTRPTGRLSAGRKTAGRTITARSAKASNSGAGKKSSRSSA